MELSSDVEFNCDCICEVELLIAVAACCKSVSDLIVAGTVADAVVDVVDVVVAGAATLLACITS